MSLANMSGQARTAVTSKAYCQCRGVHVHEDASQDGAGSNWRGRPRLLAWAAIMGTSRRVSIANLRGMIVLQ